MVLRRIKSLIHYANKGFANSCKIRMELNEQFKQFINVQSMILHGGGGGLIG